MSGRYNKTKQVFSLESVGLHKPELAATTATVKYHCLLYIVDMKSPRHTCTQDESTWLYKTVKVRDVLYGRGVHLRVVT